jgi:hypothetical protein
MQVTQELILHQVLELFSRHGLNAYPNTAHDCVTVEIPEKTVNGADFISYLPVKTIKQAQQIIVNFVKSELC